MKGQLLDSKCGITKMVSGSFETVTQRTREVLKEYGFGILTEIDVKQTMKEKLGIEYPPFMILGACNPNIAHQALETDPAIGLFMPCNVMVRQMDNKIEVSAVNPHQMVVAAGNDKLTPMAEKAYDGLKKAIDKL